MRTAVLLALFLLQESFVDRAKIETSAGRVKVVIDGVTLFEGPGAKAVVGTAKAHDVTFVTVAVDGEERVRLWAKESNPLKVPDPRVCEAESMSLRTATDGDMVTLSLIPVVDGKQRTPVVIYEGPGVTTPSMATVKGALEITHDGKVVFRAPRKRPEAAPVKAYTVADFVAKLNAHRKAAGVPEVKPHVELSKACDLHALYLCKNMRRAEASGLNAHKEFKELPGYTEEGEAVAGKSVIHIFGGKKDLLISVDALMATVYHRFAMLDPRLTLTGVGWAFDPDGVAAVVIHCGQLAGKDAGPVAYPGDGQKDVPLEFGLGNRETPDPVPDPRATAGYPITLQWPEKGWQPKNATASLRLDGKEIACWVSTPEKPARSDWPQDGQIAILPKEKLAAGKTYTVEVKCARSDDSKEFVKTWSFTTLK
jgi:uncharacterized protein YkwD